MRQINFAVFIIKINRRNLLSSIHYCRHNSALFINRFIMTKTLIDRLGNSPVAHASLVSTKTEFNSKDIF